MRSVLDWIRQEALSNPVVLRESGLAYCRRELGMNPGRGKILLTALMILFILVAPFLIDSRRGISFDVSLLVCLLTMPVMLLAGMIDAPRAFSGGTDRAYTEDLLLTPLGTRSIAHGKVFARGLPVFAYATAVGLIGIALLCAYALRILFHPQLSGAEFHFISGFLCVLGSTVIARCYLGGLRAGLHGRHVALRAIAGYLKVLLAALLVLVAAVLYASPQLIPTGGIAVAGISIDLSRGLTPVRQSFRVCVVLSAVPFLLFWCSAVYTDLVASLDLELKRRLGLLED